MGMRAEEQLPKERDAQARIHSFDEVCTGYAAEQAIAEARRCLQCPLPRCEQGCPAGVPIKRFIQHIAAGDADAALAAILEKNALPGVCGRVCPAEFQCQKLCVSRPAIHIQQLERFAVDHGVKQDSTVERSDTHRRIAVIGSGPAGLSCSADLVKQGYAVTLFEALHEAGGVLTYGIPEFRLPKRIVQAEVEAIKKAGVALELNAIAGRTVSLAELLKEYDAVFIATGAGLPHLLAIPGEQLGNVLTANEFLTRTNLMRAYRFPDYATPLKRAQKTVVVGGGNVALDAARAARRLGAAVTIIYRRTRDEMPARSVEILHAEEEGIIFQFQVSPIRILGSSAVEGIACIRMELGEPDASGRAALRPLPGSDFVIPCDQLIVAIGQSPNPLLSRTSGLVITQKGTVRVDENYRTSLPQVFAGGDAISGAATVIKAIADGKAVARAIDEMLKGPLSH